MLVKLVLAEMMLIFNRVDMNETILPNGHQKCVLKVRCILGFSATLSGILSHEDDLLPNRIFIIDIQLLLHLI